MSRDYERDSDDDRERDRYPSRRQKSSTATILLIVGGLGCFVVLACGGLIAFAIWGISAFATKMGPAQNAADQFLNELQQNQIDRAYSQTSKEYQKRMTKEQFADFVKQFEMFGKHTSREVFSTHMFTDQNGSKVTLKMTLKSPNNAMTCTIILVEEQENWRVNTLSVP